MYLRRTVWSFVAVTFVLYLTLMLWTLPVVSGAAGGLVPLDLRYFGYDLNDSIELVTNLSLAGRSFYSDVHIPLDNVYALLLAVTSALALIYILGPKRSKTCQVAGTVAFIGAIFDWRENMLIGKIMESRPEAISEELTTMASLATSLKLLFQVFPVLLVCSFIIVRSLSTFKQNSFTV